MINKGTIEGKICGPIKFLKYGEKQETFLIISLEHTKELREKTLKKIIEVSVFGNLVPVFENLKEGEKVIIEFELSSRSKEHNGNIYYNTTVIAKEYKYSTQGEEPAKQEPAKNSPLNLQPLPDAPPAESDIPF